MFRKSVVTVVDYHWYDLCIKGIRSIDSFVYGGHFMTAISVVLVITSCYFLMKKD